jgi:AcrR family transcriptional regulator
MANFSPEMPAKLAESAFKLFARHGIQSVNMEQVARHAGVTKGSLYWHYQSKHELILASCSHYYRAYQRGINARLAGITDPHQRLEQTIRQAVRTCLLDSENRVFTLEVFTLSLHDEEVRRS